MIRAEVIRPYPMIFDTGDWSRLQRSATSLATGGSARPGGNTSLMVTARRWHAISDQRQLNRALIVDKVRCAATKKYAARGVKLAAPGWCADVMGEKQAARARLAPYRKITAKIEPTVSKKTHALGGPRCQSCGCCWCASPLNPAAYLLLPLLRKSVLFVK